MRQKSSDAQYTRPLMHDQAVLHIMQYVTIEVFLISIISKRRFQNLSSDWKFLLKFIFITKSSCLGISYCSATLNIFYYFLCHNKLNTHNKLYSRYLLNNRYIDFLASIEFKFDIKVCLWYAWMINFTCL